MVVSIPLLGGVADMLLAQHETQLTALCAETAEELDLVASPPPSKETDEEEGGEG